MHLPRAPSALLSRAEREKVFLEVHIQNLTQDAMWLERMQFECVEDWQLDEKSSSMADEDIFSGSMALMQPQDMRQYIYALSPKILPAFPVTHTPGSSIALGRLDISWRSLYGEPGRLLTSVIVSIHIYRCYCGSDLFSGALTTNTFNSSTPARSACCTTALTPFKTTSIGYPTTSTAHGISRRQSSLTPDVTSAQSTTFQPACQSR